MAEAHALLVWHMRSWDNRQPLLEYVNLNRYPMSINFATHHRFMKGILRKFRKSTKGRSKMELVGTWDSKLSWWRMFTWRNQEWSLLAYHDKWTIRRKTAGRTRSSEPTDHRLLKATRPGMALTPWRHSAGNHSTNLRGNPRRKEGKELKLGKTRKFCGNRQLGHQTWHRPGPAPEQHWKSRLVPFQVRWGALGQKRWDYRGWTNPAEQSRSHLHCAEN